ncbi:hypothetical protein BT63DRAFT_456926 [Microthyrium microscopicum]|uniref:Uncharacterized protein n=1 Tax=Microthyrium microscopicum TaxID=703497 RepID=A0A6A6U7M2_9PEZI|nr:hypothetical protein BT63DRAFT_456926 [Microthyrium microscopicum]
MKLSTSLAFVTLVDSVLAGVGSSEYAKRPCLPFSCGKKNWQASARAKRFPIEKRAPEVTIVAGQGRPSPCIDYMHKTGVTRKNLQCKSSFSVLGSYPLETLI